jgi:small subunit ribosomal protein S1
MCQNGSIPHPMSNTTSETFVPGDETPQNFASFAEILSDFEREHAETGSETVRGTVISVGPETILVDIGRKIEGALPLWKWRETQPGEPEAGATVLVSVGPRNEEGYHELSTVRVERPKDWAGLQAAFAENKTIAGRVVEQVKGGFRIDIGVRAFMPASRSGVREMDQMETLVGQDIECRITKLDIGKEDVVVDRRIVIEEQEGERRRKAFEDLREGAVVRGRVRTVMEYGAFVDIGGVDGLLHVADISHARIAKASDAVSPGDELEVKILKLDRTNRKVALGLKQLQEDPWAVASRTFKIGERVSGTVSRLADFGAFVELMPGVEGLIHVSELSWNKRVRKPGDLLKTGERVEAVILQMNAAEKRIALGYKQVLGDPWDAAEERFRPGAIVEGPVTNLTAFGAFVELADGIEGMIHIGDITNEKRLQHPKEKLAKGQAVRAVVLEADRERRRIRLGMKQLEPTTVDRYISEHRKGDTVTGRLLEINGGRAKVELGEGITAVWQMRKPEEKQESGRQERAADVSSLGAMLAARWKQGAPGNTGGEAARAGQMRTFRISNLDPEKKLIELEIAS